MVDAHLVEVVRSMRCGGIVVVHRDLSLTCTQDMCSADGIYRHGSDAWLLAHSEYYGCDFLIGHKCPRCSPVKRVATQDLPGGQDFQVASDGAISP